MTTADHTLPALICLAHLGWDFVFQRPQHLMTRAAQTRRVYYVQLPNFGEGAPHLQVQSDPSGVQVLTPQLPAGYSPAESQAMTAELLRDLVTREHLSRYDLWVYTPMELPIAAQLKPEVVVYDCMDELANFRYAPTELRGREQQLFKQADLVFTGGYRLWEAKREQHPRAYPFPSSVDKAHFAAARTQLSDPADQRDLPRPRLGFYGVIDERFDTALMAEVAQLRPEWQFVLLGPVVKIAESDLPRAGNLHYLGMKSYAELPTYLAHWDVALMPFARNEATEFISPTKTPEYLAAGAPVVSTSIRDVVRPYGEQGLVHIADCAQDFVAACELALSEGKGGARAKQADVYLQDLSWEQTWNGMSTLLEQRRSAKQRPAALSRKALPVEAADD